MSKNSVPSLAWRLGRQFSKPSLCKRNGSLIAKFHASSSSNASEQAPVFNVPPTRISTITNGMRVATEDSWIPTCTVGVWIDAGSRFENDRNNGVAHFLEHMAFKGTGRRTQLQLELEVENLGAHLNAYTSREQTVYYAKCFEKDLEKSVDILSDILLHSKFGKGEIERERSVILREMQEIEQNLQEVVFDILHAKAYEGYSLARTILGPSENIKSIQREDLVQYIETHYKGPRMVLAAAGGVNHDYLVELAEKYFGNLNSDVPPSYFTPSKFQSCDVHINDESMPLVHAALALEGVGWEDADNIPLMIMNTLIGQYDRSQISISTPSRLSKKISGSDCISFQAFNTCYKETGMFGVYFVCQKEYASQMVKLIQNEWKYFCENLTDEDVERGKRLLKTNMLLVLDGSTPICEDIGRQMLCYGRRIPLHELDARIRAIDTDVMKSVCRKYVVDGAVVLSAVGATENLEPISEIQARLKF